MKRLTALLVCLCLILGLCACGGTAQTQAPGTEAPASAVPETEAPATETPATEAPADAEAFVFTDSVGREVTLPREIQRVAITGPMAQMVVFAIAPDLLVGIASEWDPSAEEYLDTEYYNLPILGQLYGGQGEMNLEELLAADPQVVIDVGETKDSVKEDLDALQEQTGIPFVHISATLETYPETYRMLGELLNRQEEAETIASFCAETYNTISTSLEGVERVKALYIIGSEGLNVIAKGSYHAEVLDLLTDNQAVVDEPSSRGTGNEVDMEQLMNWDPDYIIFSPDSIYDTLDQYPAYQALKAISSGNYAKTPMGPYNWMGFPPSVQRYLGMLWMAKLLYPDMMPYDLYEEVAEYFQLFYHCDLTQEQFDALMGDSLDQVS